MVSRKSARTGTSFWYLGAYGKGFREIGTADEIPTFSESLRAVDGRKEVSAPLPLHRVAGKGKWPDWSLFDAPVVSDRTLETLGHLLAPCSFAVPWFKEESRGYSVLKVTAQIPRERWKAKTVSQYGKTIASVDTVSISSGELPHMFYLSGYTGRIFVSDALAQASFAARLGGIIFVDPRIPAMHLAFIPYRAEPFGSAFIHYDQDI